MQSVSQEFEIATNSSLSISDRKRAALKLEEPERKEARTLLIARLPGRWDSVTANDIILLGNIGDEDTAQELEQMYTVVPNELVNNEYLPDILHNAVAVIRNEYKTHALQTAQDPNVYWGERCKAALRVNKLDRKRLQTQLLARIPGKWDATTVGDICVLGEIGDHEAATQLEAIYTKPDYADTGKMTSILRSAVRQIRERASSATQGTLI